MTLRLKESSETDISEFSKASLKVDNNGPWTRLGIERVC